MVTLFYSCTIKTNNKKGTVGFYSEDIICFVYNIGKPDYLESD